MVEVIVNGEVPSREEAIEAARKAVLEHISQSVGVRPKKITVWWNKEEDIWETELDCGGTPMIVRTRRVTGYLAPLTTFVASKVSEAHDRVKHMHITGE